jgi:hypothetical protein
VADVKVSVLSPSDEPAWREYVNAHPDATIYHTLEWRDILYNEYRVEPVYLIAKEGERIVGVLPMFFVKNLRGRRLMSLPFSIYGGPVCDSAEALYLLINCAWGECEEKGIGSLTIRTGGHITGFSAGKEYISSVLDIDKDMDAIWNMLKYNTRTAIRRARSNGLSFNFATDDDAIKAFYSLQLRSRKRQGLPTPSLRYYRSIVNGLNGRARLAIVRQGDTPLAGGLFFAFKDTFLFAQGASDYRYQNWRPNDLLVWEAIKRAHGEGFKSFDFGLTPCDDEELLFFKRKWGGSLTPWYDCVYPETERAGRHSLLYNAGSAVFRRLPLWASARVGGAVIRCAG